MDMKTFKTLEFAAIFGALGWFWWNQRQERLRREDEAKRKSAEADSDLPSEDSQDERG